MSDVRFIRVHGRIVPVRGKRKDGELRVRQATIPEKAISGLKKGAAFGVAYGLLKGLMKVASAQSLQKPPRVLAGAMAFQALRGAFFGSISGAAFGTRHVIERKAFKRGKA